MEPATYEITDENFDRLVLQNPQPFVLCFSADWSGSCDIMNAIINDLAPLHAGISYGRIDSCSHRALTESFGVISIPTILVFLRGKVVDMIVGMISSRELVKKVTER